MPRYTVKQMQEELAAHERALVAHQHYAHACVNGESHTASETYAVEGYTTEYQLWRPAASYGGLIVTLYRALDQKTGITVAFFDDWILVMRERAKDLALTALTGRLAAARDVAVYTACGYVSRTRAGRSA